MYVCICHAVTDDEVNAAVDSGARTLAGLGERTRAGTSCATCHDHLEDMIETRCTSCPLAALQVA